MQRILLVIDGLDSGGAQRQMVGLAAALSSCGAYDVLLISYKKNADFYADQLRSLNVNFIIEKEPLFGGFGVIRKYIKSFSPHIIISFLGKTNLLTSFNKFFDDTPLIVSERNTTFTITKYDVIRFFLYKWVDCIVANSYTQTRYIIQNYPKLSSKTTTIVNFVNTDVFVPNRSLEDKSEIKILVVARVCPQKNTLLFIESLHKLNKENRKFCVEWFGDLSNEKYVDECKNELNKYGLEDVIAFKGECKDILKEYQKASVFCLPSLYEGTPNVICEAMACGLPILCSNVCDNGMYVEDGQNGFLFDPNNSMDVASKISSFLQLSPEQRNLMGNRSRQLAIDFFSKERFVANWRDIIEAQLAKKKKGSFFRRCRGE